MEIDEKKKPKWEGNNMQYMYLNLGSFSRHSDTKLWKCCEKVRLNIAFSALVSSLTVWPEI